MKPILLCLCAFQFHAIPDNLHHFDYPTQKVERYDPWEGHRQTNFGDDHPPSSTFPEIKPSPSKTEETPYLHLSKMSQGFVLETKQIIIPGFKAAFNPSFIKWNGSILMAFRERNEKGLSTFRMGLVWLDDEFNPISQAQILEIPQTEESSIIKYQDPRLVKIQDKLFIVYSNILDVPPGEGENRRMFSAEVHFDGTTFTASPPFCMTNFEGEKKQRWEKNWAPFEYEGNMLITYSLRPHRILSPNVSMKRVDTVANSEGSIDWDWGVLRGGTPPLIEGDEYLAFFHTCKNMKTMESGGQNITHYFFGAYTFSDQPPFNITRISPEPIVAPDFYWAPDYKTWKPLRVVFPCGHFCDENYVWIAYGKQDHECWVVKLDKKQLLESLKPVETK